MHAYRGYAKEKIRHAYQVCAKVKRVHTDQGSAKKKIRSRFLRVKVRVSEIEI